MEADTLNLDDQQQGEFTHISAMLALLLQELEKEGKVTPIGPSGQLTAAFGLNNEGTEPQYLLFVSVTKNDGGTLTEFSVSDSAGEEEILYRLKNAVQLLTHDISEDGMRRVTAQYQHLAGHTTTQGSC